MNPLEPLVLDRIVTVLMPDYDAILVSEFRNVLGAGGGVTVGVSENVVEIAVVCVNYGYGCGIAVQHYQVLVSCDHLGIAEVKVLGVNYVAHVFNKANPFEGLGVDGGLH